MTTIAVLTTVDSKEHADRIAAALVRRKRHAFVHDTAIDITYKFDLEVKETPEYTLKEKTTYALYP